MPILYAIGIGIILLSMKGKIEKFWDVTLTLVIWINIFALVWRLFPPLHTILFIFLDKIIHPYLGFLQPFINFFRELIPNLLKILTGLGVG